MSSPTAIPTARRPTAAQMPGPRNPPPSPAPAPHAHPPSSPHVCRHRPIAIRLPPGCPQTAVRLPAFKLPSYFRHAAFPLPCQSHPFAAPTAPHLQLPTPSHHCSTAVHRCPDPQPAQSFQPFKLPAHIHLPQLTCSKASNTISTQLPTCLTAASGPALGHQQPADSPGLHGRLSSPTM